MPPRSIHLNGSVNLPDAETVLREVSSRIPAGLRRMTDGETGERGYWVVFQVRKLASMPEFETVASETFRNTSAAPPMPRLRLAAGVAAESVRWPDLGYATAYASSFGTFARLQADEIIPAGVRFQMQYPTPLAAVRPVVAPPDSEAVQAAYEQALFADLDRALTQLPRDAIAVQWDVCIEFGLLEGALGPAGPVPLQQVVPGVVRCVSRVPPGVPAGLHLCYGDYGHEHFAQPESLAMQVRLVNAVAAASPRPLDFVAFTVPQARDDAAYFAPLRELVTGTGTELCFGIVPYHPAAQAAGTTGRQVREIDAALAASPAGPRGWSICTECGMGRAGRDEVPLLLDLHRLILEQSAAG